VALINIIKKKSKLLTHALTSFSEEREKAARRGQMTG
jgi:hypothetical protein